MKRNLRQTLEITETTACQLAQTAIKVLCILILFLCSLAWVIVAYGQNDSFNIAIAGDWGCTHNTNKTANNIADKDPELVLIPGDLSYESAPDCWYKIISPFASKTKIAIGNHDDEITNEYLNHFNLSQSFYSFDYENVHVLVMDTESSYKVNSTQYNFVKEDLNAASLNSTIDWIFVMLHRPMYTSHAAHGGSDTLRTAYHQLFSEYDVNLVLQSHNHLYERTLPLQFNSKDPGEPIIDITKNSTNSSNYVSPSNPLFITVGTAGHSLDSLDEHRPYVACVTNRHYGFLNINVTNEMLSAKFHANSHLHIADAVIDSFTITKNNQGQVTPSSTSHCVSLPLSVESP